MLCKFINDYCSNWENDCAIHGCFHQMCREAENHCQDFPTPENGSQDTNTRCQRCGEENGQFARVRSEIIDMRVCEECANVAFRLIQTAPRGGMTVEVVQ